MLQLALILPSTGLLDPNLNPKPQTLRAAACPGNFCKGALVLPSTALLNSKP
jgi:hypothetical protein